jgi:hypothetical protein
MAMTKKERADMNAAIDRAETLAALRWTAPVERDVMPPERGGYTEGWDFNVYSMQVWRGWSSCVSHGIGPAPIEGRHHSGSQNARRMFSTKEKALRAMRHEMELQFAADLLKVERRIASAQVLIDEPSAT